MIRITRKSPRSKCTRGTPLRPCGKAQARSFGAMPEIQVGSCGLPNHSDSPTPIMQCPFVEGHRVVPSTLVMLRASESVAGRGQW